MSSRTENRGYLQHHVFQCDHCGEEQEPDEVEFRDAWQSLKIRGWKFSDSKHFCPECEEYAR